MSYTSLDHFIARMRFKAAYPHIRKGARVCDLGCGLDAAFLDFAAERIAYGVGVDDQVRDGARGKWQRVRQDIREPLPLESAQFDNVVMLAVLEHLADPEPVLREAHRILQQILHRIGFNEFIHYTFELGLNNLMVATR